MEVAKRDTTNRRQILGSLMFQEQPAPEDELSIESEDAISNVLAAPPEVQDFIEAEFVNHLVATVHEENAHWWVDLNTGEPIQITPELVLSKLMLVVTELAEAAEGSRKGIPDTHLPDRPMFEVEMADAVIRIFDLAAATGIDLGGAFVAKRKYNAHREDHKRESRLAENGKKL